MSWKFVFNSNNLRGGTTLEKVTSVAEEAGYDFFTFNGDVYFIAAGIPFKTKIKSVDLF